MAVSVLPLTVHSGFLQKQWWSYSLSQGDGSVGGGEMEGGTQLFVTLSPQKKKKKNKFKIEHFKLQPLNLLQ